MKLDKAVCTIAETSWNGAQLLVRCNIISDQPVKKYCAIFRCESNYKKNDKRYQRVWSLMKPCGDHRSVNFDSWWPCARVYPVAITSTFNCIPNIKTYLDNGTATEIKNDLYCLAPSN